MAAWIYDIFSKVIVFVVTILTIADVEGAPAICDPLQAPANGMSSCSTNGISLFCKATCNAGYVFSTGDTSITKACSDVLGGWQGGRDFPKCLKDSTITPTPVFACSPLRSPANGIVSCSANGTSISCTATCNSGYKFLTGDTFVSKTCSRATGGWNSGEALPECIAKTCREPLLSTVNDSQITASSVWSGARTYYFGPERARMKSDVTNSGSLVLAGGWRPANNTLDQYIQVKLNTLTRITGISTAGRIVLSGDTASEYVTRFRVLYSVDGITWEPYSSETVSDQFLDGNRDNVTPNINTLSCPFDALYVRINPLAWHENIALRFELYGCEADGTKPVCKSSLPTTQAVNTPPATTIAVPPLDRCHAIPPPTHGLVNCEQRGNEIVCVASCAEGYIFETKEVLVKRICEKDTGAWPSGNVVPACLKNPQVTPEPPSHNFTHGCLKAESNCNKIGNGDFQACGGCHYFSTCSEGFLYIRACPERLLFDAVSMVCDYHSRTCPGA